MAYMVTHFFEGGNKEQYEKVVAAARPSSGLVRGELCHSAGPTEGGWLVIGIWESKDALDAHVHNDLLPVLQKTEGGLVGPPQERTAEVVNLITE